VLSLYIAQQVPVMHSYFDQRPWGDCRLAEERDEVRNSLARTVGRRARKGPKQLLFLFSAADNYSE
jgi:hypothetical protein